MTPRYEQTIIIPNFLNMRIGVGRQGDVWLHFKSETDLHKAGAFCMNDIAQLTEIPLQTRLVLQAWIRERVEEAKLFKGTNPMGGG